MFFDRELLRTELVKTIGFYQTSNSNYPLLSPSLISSKYDRYVNEVNGLITTENIHQSIKNFYRYTFPQWEGSTTAYDAADYVTDNGINYECVQNAPIGTLLTDTAFWFQLDDFNNYHIQKRFQAVDRAIDSVINGKKMRNKVKSIYDNTLLYDGSANYRDREKNASNFVGLRFRMKSQRSLVTLINKIGHQFSEAVAFNMYLYHSSQQTPLAVIPISHTKPNSSQWTPSTEVMTYLSDDHDAGGEYFLGYAQSDLGTSEALNMYGLDWYNGFNCSDCNKTSYDYYQNYSNFIDVTGFTISESNFTVGVDLFDPQDVGITASRNYGLNINMTNKCNLTTFILEEDRMMAEAINNVAALEILKDMSSNTRESNNTANITRSLAGKQTVTFEGADGTVRDVAENSLKGLSFDLSGLNDECLPCDDNNADVIIAKAGIV